MICEWLLELCNFYRDLLSFFFTSRKLKIRPLVFPGCTDSRFIRAVSVNCQTILQPKKTMANFRNRFNEFRQIDRLMYRRLDFLPSTTRQYFCMTITNSWRPKPIWLASNFTKNSLQNWQMYKYERGYYNLNWKFKLYILYSFHVCFNLRLYGQLH